MTDKGFFEQKIFPDGFHRVDLSVPENQENLAKAALSEKHLDLELLHVFGLVLLAARYHEVAEKVRRLLFPSGEGSFGCGGI